jgi:hypothetical protein
MYIYVCAVLNSSSSSIMCTSLLSPLSSSFVLLLYFQHRRETSTLRCSTFPSDLFLFVRAVQILKALAEEADLIAPPPSHLPDASPASTTTPQQHQQHYQQRKQRGGGWSLAETWRPHALGLLREAEFAAAGIRERS